jgi:alpha-N-arabinofuranosidase
MANIAQIVNVLASVILTEGSEMILTPTYYAFHMYRYHQGADLLHTNLTENSMVGTKEQEQVPKITQTASVDSDGMINLTITNVSADQPEQVSVSLAGMNDFKVTEARILSGKIDDYNTFEEHDTVSEAEFNGYAVAKGALEIKLPPCSIVLVRIEENK